MSEMCKFLGESGICKFNMFDGIFSRLPSGAKMEGGGPMGDFTNVIRCGAARPPFNRPIEQVGEDVTAQMDCSGFQSTLPGDLSQLGGLRPGAQR